MALTSFWSLLLLSLLLWMIPKSTSTTPNYLYNFCSNTTTFTPNSQYHTNLNTLFHSLSSNTTTGFHTASVGHGTPNAIYGLFLCRGDQNLTSCHNCVLTATTSDLPKKYCPNGKTAVIWYDECMVRYSNESFFGKMDQSPKVYFLDHRNVTTNLQSQFADTLGKMMHEIADEAATGRSGGKRYATRVAKVGGDTTTTLYGLGQCTPDLTNSDCNLCLRIAIGSLRIMMSGSVLQPSCVVEFDTDPFFDAVAITNSTSAGPEISPNGNSKGKAKFSAKVIIAIVVSIAIILAALLAIGMYLITHKKAKKYKAFTTDESGEDFTTIESLQYDLNTLQYATGNFSEDNKLGEGGFGVVYKGTLKGGREIAVKRLSRSSAQGVQEFKNEILLVAKLQHRNLVRLLGFCLEGKEKLLVYEYVPHKSLDHFLFDPVQQRTLDWSMRYKIIIGIARGMLYLHQDARLRIIHRDLKASNVLLDGDMNPKIADFGMARIFGIDQSEGNTSRVVGTYGYMAPEYAMHGQISVKSDVYSFGVLVLEIISGKRISTFYESGKPIVKRWKKTLRTSLLVAIPITAIMLSLLCFGTWICLSKKKTMERYAVEIEAIRTVESLQFNFSTIRNSTNNFSPHNKLGEGGFGEVYKGKLESGQEVAIKRLSRTSGQGVEEFRTEVVLVAKLQHKNLVKLLGFCVTPKEKILVYEYLPNSSLDRFIFDSTKKASLDWQMRLSIMAGIARGLSYLHEDSRLKVIHRDLKTSNILLDEVMNPKISDFGLAKLFGVDQTQGDTNKIVGTYGYMAPEYALTGRYSVKSDVYSFGVLVLEIVSGQKNRFFGRVQLEEALLHRAWRLWNEARPLDLVDPTLTNNFSTEEVLKCIHISLLCIQEDATQRPRMTSLVAALSGQSIDLPTPKPPHFFSWDSSTENHSTLDEHTSPCIYTGRKTITNLCPRD